MITKQETVVLYKGNGNIQRLQKTNIGLYEHSGAMVLSKPLKALKENEELINKIIVS